MFLFEFCETFEHTFFTEYSEQLFLSAKKFNLGTNYNLSSRHNLILLYFSCFKTQNLNLISAVVLALPNLFTMEIKDWQTLTNKRASAKHLMNGNCWILKKTVIIKNNMKVVSEKAMIYQKTFFAYERKILELAFLISKPHGISKGHLNCSGWVTWSPRRDLVNFHVLPPKWCVETIGEWNHKVMCGECQLSLAVWRKFRVWEWRSRCILADCWG